MPYYIEYIVYGINRSRRRLTDDLKARSVSNHVQPHPPSQTPSPADQTEPHRGRDGHIRTIWPDRVDSVLSPNRLSFRSVSNGHITPKNSVSRYIFRDQKVVSLGYRFRTEMGIDGCSVHDLISTYRSPSRVAGMSSDRRGRLHLARSTRAWGRKVKVTRVAPKTSDSPYRQPCQQTLVPLVEGISVSPAE